MAESLAAQGRIALENARLHDLVRRQAQTDELTDLANRRRFMNGLEQEIARANRLGTALSLVLFDLDRFKRVNDRCGHQVGDLVLRRTADAVCEHIRGTDLAARVGGEEFAVLLPGSDASGAATFAENLRRAVEREVIVEGVAWPTTASFEVAQIRRECRSRPWSELPIAPSTKRKLPAGTQCALPATSIRAPPLPSPATAGRG